MRPSCGRLVDLQQLERRLAALDQVAFEIDTGSVGEALEDLLGHGNWAPASRRGDKRRYATRFLSGKSRPRWTRSTIWSPGFRAFTRVL